MTTRIAINGFGRIGRQSLKALLERAPDVEVVAINDLVEPELDALLFKHDSTYGTFPGDVRIVRDRLVIDDREILVLREDDIDELPWGDLGVDIVLESTGRCKQAEQARPHLDRGARTVIISGPAKGADLTVVLGVNDERYDPDAHRIISNASCTTNCLAPIVKVLHDTVGIEHALMDTIHSYTNDQRVLDVAHKDPRRARAAGQNIIPTTTGAAKAIGLVIPELKGKLDGVSIRVPTPNVSVVDLKFVSSRATTKDEINDAVRKAAKGPLKGVLAFTDAPNVSHDFNHDPNSSIFHMDQTKVMDGNFVSILSWYDNEWGFSNRMADVAVHMAKLI
jgi:glyceraldehyde 3-phosphate dehydrogenase